MPNKTLPPFLPADILLHIIDCLVPPSILSPVAYPPSHPITVTLLSLTRTCRVTYPTARRLLHARCLYIDSPNRLYRLLESLAYNSACTAHPPLAESRTLPNVPLLHHITSLYLSPCHHRSINHRLTSEAIHDLFCLLAPTLRRLIIDIPLRSLYMEDDHLDVRPILRRAFVQLVQLELFCSVRDELFLDTLDSPLNIDEPCVWSLWPKLRTLALYNADVGWNRFWQELGRLRCLRTLVLTRSDGLYWVDLKREWRRYCGDEKRSLNIVLVNVESEHEDLLGRDEWKEDDKVVVSKVNVPTSYYGDDNHIELCQEWVERRILSGEVGVSQTWWD